MKQALIINLIFTLSLAQALEENKNHDNKKLDRIEEDINLGSHTIRNGGRDISQPKTEIKSRSWKDRTRKSRRSGR